MKSTIFSKVLLVSAALLFSIFTCFGQEKAADKLVGTWIKVVETNTITLTLAADKKSTVEFDGDDVIDVYGSYKISGKQITFQDEGGDYAADVPGTYEFKVDDSSITFTTVDDPVNGRRMLVEGSWSKVVEKEKGAQ
jgi:hypothetical protein